MYIYNSTNFRVLLLVITSKSKASKAPLQIAPQSPVTPKSPYYQHYQHHHRTITRLLSPNIFFNRFYFFLVTLYVFMEFTFLELPYL